MFKKIILFAVFLLPLSACAKANYPHELKFSIEGHEELRGKIYQLNKEKFDENRIATGRKEVFGIDTYDINDDGIQDVFVRVETSCASSGCEFYAYLRDGQNQLTPLTIPLMLTTSHISVLEGDSEGFHDLAFRISASASKKESIHIWKWNGKEYKCTNCNGE